MLSNKVHIPGLSRGTATSFYRLIDGTNSPFGQTRIALDNEAALGVQGASNEDVFFVNTVDMAVGINTDVASSKIAGTGIVFDIVGLGSSVGAMRIASDTTNNTFKNARFLTRHYLSAEEDVGFFQVTSTDSANFVYYGGGSTINNAATSLGFYTAANTTTLQGTQRMNVTSGGKVQIGLYDTSNASQLLVQTSIAVADNLTNLTSKFGRIRGVHYTTAEEPVTGIFIASTATTNRVDIGGGTSIENAATDIRFFAAANNTTTTGTLQCSITTALTRFTPDTSFEIKGDKSGLFVVRAADGEPKLVINSASDTISSTNTRWDITSSLIDIATTTAGASFISTITTPGGNNAQSHRGMNITISYTGSNTLSSTDAVTGLIHATNNVGGGTIASMRSVSYVTSVTNGSTTTLANSITISMGTDGASTLTEAIGMRFIAPITAPTASYAFRFDSSQWVSNDRAIKISDDGTDAYLPISMVDTGLTFPANNQLVLAVTNQAANSNDGVGIQINTDDGGTAGNTDGGDLDINLGNPSGTGRIGQFLVDATSKDASAVVSAMATFSHTVTPTVSSSKIHRGLVTQIKHTGAFDLTNTTAGVVAGRSRVSLEGSATIAKAIAHEFVLSVAGDTLTEGSITQLQAFRGAGTFTRVNAFDLLNNSGTVANNYAFKLAASSDWKNGESLLIDDGGTDKQIPIASSAELTLGVGVTTFAVTGSTMNITGDGGGNTIATITGGYPGQLLVLHFEDTNVTITDDNSGSANVVNLSAAFTSASKDILILVKIDGYWEEISRSNNG